MRACLTCLFIFAVTLPNLCQPAPTCTGTVVDDQGIAWLTWMLPRFGLPDLALPADFGPLAVPGVMPKAGFK
jgi:hypothetical protein